MSRKDTALLSIYRSLQYWFWRLSTTRLTLGPNIARYYMYDRMRETAKSFASRKGDVLSVSQSGWLCNTMHLEPTRLVEADYPEYNLLALPFADASFDFVVCDMVLEHVEGNPQKAVDEIRRILRDGGVAVLATAFIYRFHPAPGDFWRFSSQGLRLLFADFSRVLDCDGWGNFKATRLLRTKLRYVGIPRAPWHPLHRVAVKNDPEWPIATWIVAQK